MKAKTRAYAYAFLFAGLTVLSGLAFVNNVSAIARWWMAFNASGGDAALVPATCPGIIPWLDWSAVDYSCVATFIPFLGFLLITLGLGRVVAGKQQDPESFPFFKGYDQLNIALGLIGTLWGIIIIGFFQMDSITMGHLMMCLHTALFSTLMAVAWVFIFDHGILRPLVLDVLQGVQGSEHEDEDILQVLGKLTESAAGLSDVWDGNRDHLTALNDSIARAHSGLRELGSVGNSVGEILSRELTASARSFITEMEKSSERLASRQDRMEAAFQERQAKLDVNMSETTRLLGFLTSLLSGMQSAQENFAAAAEKLAAENATLLSGIGAERTASGILRGKVAELQGESEGRRKQIDELLEKMKSAEEAFNKRHGALRAENDRIASELAKVDGEKSAAEREARENHVRAEKAEKLVEKIKSAFNV